MKGALFLGLFPRGPENRIHIYTYLNYFKDLRVPGPGLVKKYKINSTFISERFRWKTLLKLKPCQAFTILYSA